MAEKDLLVVPNAFWNVPGLSFRTKKGILLAHLGENANSEAKGCKSHQDVNAYLEQVVISVDPRAIQDSALDAHYDARQTRIHTSFRLNGTVPKAALDLLNDLQQDSATPLPAAAPVVPAVVEKDDEMDKHSDRMSVDKPSVEIKQEDEDEWALLPKLPTGFSPEPIVISDSDHDGKLGESDKLPKSTLKPAVTKKVKEPVLKVVRLALWPQLANGPKEDAPIIVPGVGFEISNTRGADGQKGPSIRTFELLEELGLDGRYPIGAGFIEVDQKLNDIDFGECHLRIGELTIKDEVDDDGSPLWENRINTGRVMVEMSQTGAYLVRLRLTYKLCVGAEPPVASNSKKTVPKAAKKEKPPKVVPPTPEEVGTTAHIWFAKVFHGNRLSFRNKSGGKRAVVTRKFSDWRRFGEALQGAEEKWTNVGRVARELETVAGKKVTNMAIGKSLTDRHLATFLGRQETWLSNIQNGLILFQDFVAHRQAWIVHNAGERKFGAQSWRDHIKMHKSDLIPIGWRPSQVENGSDEEGGGEGEGEGDDDYDDDE